MGLSESKLVPQTVKPLVRPDSITPLPSFALDSAKFMDGSLGFLITTIDLAKNSNVRTFSVKFMYSPAENCLVYVGNDETILTFVKDRLSDKVLCSVNTLTAGTIVRHCVSTYEALEDPIIDRIASLFPKKP